ncbi:MAG: serine/threonine-protein kinase [Deltaproteobacteria bacterium]|nr:serine/threonine-protein kinase [Deltaproteobacteria bacterium]
MHSISDQNLIGQRIAGRYDVLREIAEGGMGIVYEAVHVEINRRVALKVLHSDIVGDGESAQRFLNEARAVNAARHHNIVEVSDFGYDGGRTFLVMEMLDGATLREWREAHKDTDAKTLVSVMLPIGRALAFAHERGFVHRDVKPENIIIARVEGAPAPTPKLLDFGIAKHRASLERLTRTGATLGTPMYMAPEQIGASRDVGPEADQYAFGCVLYELLSGKAPFSAKSLPALAMAKATQDPTALADLAPALDPTLAAFVTRAMAREPEARWPHMRDLCDAIEPFGGGEIPWIAARERPANELIVPTKSVPSPVIPRVPLVPQFAMSELLMTQDSAPESLTPPSDSERPAHIPPSSERPHPSINRVDPTKRVRALSEVERSQTIEPMPLASALATTARNRGRGLILLVTVATITFAVVVLAAIALRRT